MNEQTDNKLGKLIEREAELVLKLEIAREVEVNALEKELKEVIKEISEILLTVL